MIRDFRSALRWLAKNPLFTAAVTAILALGIGANTAVFSIVDAVLLRPLPYEASPRLVRIEEGKREFNGVPAQDYFRWRDRSDLFEKTGAHLRDFVTLTGAGEPDQVSAQRVSAGVFAMLDVRAKLGRALLDSDDQPGAPNVAELSDRLWRRRFHADPAVIGQPLTVSDKVYTIVGVMPPEFEFPLSTDELWLPLRLAPAATSLLQVIARTRERLALSQVQSAMEIVAHQLEQESPTEKAGLKIVVSPWRDNIGRQYELTLVFILAGVGLVLLIACADVGGLLLSRAVQRQKEIAIRASLGAGFWRVARQLLVESFVLAVIGSAAGVATAYFALQSLLKAIAGLPVVLPHIQRVSLNQRVLLFNLMLCLLLAGISSLAPMLLAAKVDPQGVLRSGRGMGGQRRSSRLFSILIAAETAFAFLLLVGSGLMVRSLIRLQQSDHGFRPDHVLTVRVPVGSLTEQRPAKYDTKPRQMAYYREIVARLQRIPGIQAVGVVNNLPLSGVNSTTILTAPDGQPIQNSTRTISGQYFSAMGIPLLAGRTFTEADQTGAPEVAIINQYLARQLFPGRDPLGQDLPGPDLKTPIKIVGVVKDSSQMRYDQPAKGEVYRPYQQFIFAAFMSSIVVRTTGEPLALAAALRKEVWAVDPNQPIVKVATLDDVIAASIWRPRFSAWIFSVLGGLALLLTSAGVYGIVAYTSSLRAKEVGIRVALGASPRNVVAVILRGAMTPLAIGLAISLATALLLSRLLTSILYETSSADPVAYLLAGGLLLSIGGLASVGPAWKAAVADPLEAIRNDG